MTMKFEGYNLLDVGQQDVRGRMFFPHYCRQKLWGVEVEVGGVCVRVPRGAREENVSSFVS